MYEVSDEYIELMDDETSELDVYVRCTFGGAITVDGNAIQKIELIERVNSNGNILTLGNACSNSCNITLLEPPDFGYKGISCNPECGIMMSDGSIEWVPMGKFWVDSAKTNNDFKTVKIEAYDRMYRLSMIPFSPPASEFEGEYKVLFENYVQRLEELTGITVVRPEDGFPQWYITRQIEDEKYSCRDIAGHLAGCLGRNASFNRYGDLEFIFYKQTAFKAVEELQYMKGFEKLADNALKVDFLVIGGEDEEEEPIKIENDGTDPGGLDWRPFDSYDPADFPWLTFTYNDETMTASVRLTEGYESDTEGIKIPYSLHFNENYYDVTTIEANGFEGCMAMAIVLPDTITTIGLEAFRDCDNLTEFEIPNSVTYINTQILYGCDSLETIYYNAENCSFNTSSIVGAFGNLSHDAVVVLGDGVKTIPDYAFYHGDRITAVNISYGVTSIGRRAFKDCSALVNVEIPDSVTSIGEQAFYNCEALASITIPASVTSMGKNVFYDCRSLATANVRGLITTLPDYTFYGCTALANVTLPMNLVTVGSDAFELCSSLQNIVLPESVTTINSWAFSKSGLKSFTYPSALKTMEYGAFNGCAALEEVNFNGVITEIEDYTFKGCTALVNVVIPNNVTEIGTQAFTGCTSLQTVQIGTSSACGITKIGSGAFKNDTAITDVTIYAGVDEVSGSPWGATNATINWMG